MFDRVERLLEVEGGNPKRKLIFSALFFKLREREQMIDGAVVLSETSLVWALLFVKYWP